MEAHPEEVRRRDIRKVGCKVGFYKVGMCSWVLVHVKSLRDWWGHSVAGGRQIQVQQIEQRQLKKGGIRVSYY